MDCRDVQSLIDAYFDGELDLVKSLEIEDHLKSCKKCSIAFSSYKMLHKSLLDNSFYYNAPVNLKKSINLEINKSLNKSKNMSSSLLNRQNISFAFGILLIISFILIITFRSNSGNEQLRDQVLNSHLRSLISNNLTDVLSSDKHTVKPWFNGKINFSPPVIDLNSKGFPLIGGRIDFINNEPAAVLVYHYNKHIINLFISINDKNPAAENEIYYRNGYNIIHWNNNKMDYWAVSDLNLNEFKIFSREFEKLY